MQVSVSEAARRYVVARKTIYADVKDGRLTIQTDEKGKKTVDVADLHRLYQPRHLETFPVDLETPPTPPGNSHGNAALQREIELLRERLADKDDVISDLRTRLDASTEQQKRLTILLTDQRPARPWWRKFWEPGTSTPSTEVAR